MRRLTASHRSRHPAVRETEGFWGSARIHGRLWTYLTTNLSSAVYIYSTYDTVILMAAAIGLAGGDDDAGAVAAVLPAAATRVPGTLGSLALNPNGDLDRAEYDIWHILDGAWSKSASYNPDTGLAAATP